MVSSTRLKIPHVTLPALLLAAMCAVANTDEVQHGLDAYSAERYVEAYQIFLPLAEAGDPEMQNLVGFMKFLGRGTPADPVNAHRLFHEAAQDGNVEAKLNLAILHLIDAPGVNVDAEESRRWILDLPPLPAIAYGLSTAPEGRRMAEVILRTIKPVLVVDAEFNYGGKRIFNTFCAGCHGFDGLANYPGAPSFSIGERLHKSNEALKSSIVNGKNMMPSWDNLLSPLHIEQALHYLRAIALLSRYSLLVIPATPGHPYYIFYNSDLP